jgi:hypothetical protein
MVLEERTSDPKHESKSFEAKKMCARVRVCREELPLVSEEGKMGRAGGLWSQKCHRPAASQCSPQATDPLY